jgi:uncharacterized protein
MLRPTQQTASKTGTPPEPPPLVSVRWLLAAVALTFVLAALCAYGALCLLFYQGQWQLIYHPSRTVAATPASVGMAYEEIHFDVDFTGHPRLDGWWIPADPGSNYVTATVLYLHEARGSLSSCLPALQIVHSTGINVFAFDYRGFGLSGPRHPSEARATADSVAAWTYLTDTRHILPRNLIVYGDGVGATFAAHLAAQFAPAGVILQDPNPPARQLLLADARARIVPLWLLQTEKLDPTADLAATRVPRLFIDVQGDSGAPSTRVDGVPGWDSSRARSLFNASPYPKQYFDLSSASASSLAATLTRFYDDVLSPH